MQDDDRIPSIIEDGFVEYDPSIHGDAYPTRPFNIRYFDDNFIIGNVVIITRFDGRYYHARNVPYRREQETLEYMLPQMFWVKELSESQKNAFIKPTVRRVRPPPPESMCPPVADDYRLIVQDPQNTYIAKEDMNETMLFYVHDNGGKPFKVLAHSNAIEVYCEKDELVWDEEQIYNDRIVCITDFMGMWIGYDSANYAPEALGLVDPEQNNETGTTQSNDRITPLRHCVRADYGQVNRDHGNSLLIKLTENKYVFIGWKIYSFETTTPIINYFSPLGNNDVPYPVAYGTNEVYFMMDAQYIMNRNLTTPKTLDGSDAIYREFYDSQEGVKKDMMNYFVIRKRE